MHLYKGFKLSRSLDESKTANKERNRASTIQKSPTNPPTIAPVVQELKINEADAKKINPERGQPKCGFLYKKGDGPIDYGWNLRYFILDGRMLYYFKTAADREPRGIMKLMNPTVSQVIAMEV
jgi:hypothetical protein